MLDVHVSIVLSLFTEMVYPYLHFIIVNNMAYDIDRRWCIFQNVLRTRVWYIKHQRCVKVVVVRCQMHICYKSWITFHLHLLLILIAYYISFCQGGLLFLSIPVEFEYSNCTNWIALFYGNWTSLIYASAEKNIFLH